MLSFIRDLRSHNTGPKLDQADICTLFEPSGTDRSGERAFVHVSYTVEAELWSPSGHNSVVSPRSQARLVQHWCEPEVVVKVTLEDLIITDLQDGAQLIAGSPEAEAYGSVYIHDYEVKWNTHPIGDEDNLRISPPPYTSSVFDTTYPWSNLWLRVTTKSGAQIILGSWSPGPDYATGNNVVYVPLEPGERLKLGSYVLKDHDGISSDDIWCLGPHMYLDSRSTEDWLRTDETMELAGGKGFDGECTITVRIEGTSMTALGR